MVEGFEGFSGKMSDKKKSPIWLYIVGMEVVKDTFNQSKSHIEASIANADFIAVDLEFTGVKSDIKLFPFDSSQKRYEKLKTSVSNYIITQMGVCTFHWDGTR